MWPFHVTPSGLQPVPVTALRVCGACSPVSFKGFSWLTHL